MNIKTGGQYMFELVNNRQLIFGENKINEIGTLIEWYGCKKAFCVVYPEGERVYNRVKLLLEAHGVSSISFFKVGKEPDMLVIHEGRDLYKAEKCDCTIAIGGGSVIDTAKTVGMLAVNEGNVDDYQMHGKEVKVEPPLFIAIPTTSGTGAEATKTSVVTNNDNGLKKSLYHTSMIADIVILDPALTLGLPPRLTAATGMDALSHAIESYVSLNASPMTEMFGLKSIELINQYLEKAYHEPDNLEARGNMMLASYLGGCAITAGIGIAHIMAQPLGAIYHIPHGDACSIFLPIAMELNLPYATQKYAKIAQALKVYDAAASDQENALNAIQRVKEIRCAIDAPSCLTPYIKNSPSIEELIEIVKRTTGHITCNPKPLNEQLIRDSFHMACNKS